MRIDSHGLHFLEHPPAAAEFGRNLSAKLPDLPAGPIFSGGSQGGPSIPHDNLPFPPRNPPLSQDNFVLSRGDDGFRDDVLRDQDFGDNGFQDHGFQDNGFQDLGFGDPGLTADAPNTAPDGQPQLVSEAASGDHAVAVSHEGNGTAGAASHSGQQRSTADGPAAMQNIAGGSAIQGSTATGNMAGAAVFPAAPHMETGPRAVTLLGGAGEDRLVADSREARPYGARSYDDLPAKVRNEIPLWAVQGHSAWQLRLRSASWERRRRLLRWRERLRRVAKARRKNDPLPLELVDPPL